eukprot:15206686-Ditylum_brightwellii.AAC.1
MVLTVLTSTSHIFHKQSIVILHREVRETSLLFATKMMMLMMMLKMMLKMMLMIVLKMVMMMVLKMVLM